MERPKIIGGNTTVFISNMDEAIRFYTEVLGLKLTFRFRDHWAAVEAGPGLTIGLHEARPIHPAPGTKGAMGLGRRSLNDRKFSVGNSARTDARANAEELRNHKRNHGDTSSILCG